MLDKDRKRAEEVGCNEYILKTLKMEDVDRAIDHYLYEPGELLQN
jgi:hypothetical protein